MINGLFETRYWIVSINVHCTIAASIENPLEFQRLGSTISLLVPKIITSIKDIDHETIIICSDSAIIPNLAGSTHCTLNITPITVIHEYLHPNITSIFLHHISFKSPFLNQAPHLRHNQ